VIPDYLESLARALSFDRALSRCVRQEVEDHLWEAVAADPAGDRLEAERRAIANFGDPHVIAAQFAVVSLAKQTRRVGVAVVLALAGVFIVMKARVEWYAVTEWPMSDNMRAVAGVVGLIDRYAFWLSVIIGLGGFAYIRGRRMPRTFHPAYREQLSRFFLLCAAATGALIVSVISDGALTALRLLGTELHAEFLVPILSMAIEIACAGFLVLQIRSMMQRATSTAAWLKT
jgi:hypothetical protein